MKNVEARVGGGRLGADARNRPAEDPAGRRCDRRPPSRRSRGPPSFVRAYPGGPPTAGSILAGPRCLAIRSTPPAALASAWIADGHVGSPSPRHSRATTRATVSRVVRVDVDDLGDGQMKRAGERLPLPHEAIERPAEGQMVVGEIQRGPVERVDNSATRSSGWSCAMKRCAPWTTAFIEAAVKLIVSTARTKRRAPGGRVAGREERANPVRPRRATAPAPSAENRRRRHAADGR